MAKVKKTKVRVTLDLSEDLYRRLEELMELTGSDTKTEAIKNALRLYEFYAKKHHEGYEVSLRKDGEQERIVIFGIAA